MVTLGPATDGRIDDLVAAGVDVVRLNLSHGDPADHVRRLEMVKAAGRATGRHIGVLVDLPGPKIRIAPLPDGGRRFVVGDSLSIIDDAGPMTAAAVDQVSGLGSEGDGPVVVEGPDVLGDLHVGDRIVIGDGLVSLTVMELDRSGVKARVDSGGTLYGQPGLHVPSGRSGLRTPTDRDLVLAEMAAAAGADFIAVSFVRHPDDLVAVRQVIGSRARLVAKIETAEAVEAIDGIIAVCDAVMVARGDLGIDLPFEDVPSVQKEVINRCRRSAVPVITATQMLESMTAAPLPTRAEVSDVANAVLDGTDAVMLSAETAIGAFPLEAVAVLDRVARRTEADGRHPLDERSGPDSATVASRRAFADPVTIATTEAAERAAEAVGASTIVCVTRAGRTAAALACRRPAASIIAMSADSRVADALSLTWGVDPIDVDEVADSDQLVDVVVARATALGLIRSGELVVVVAGAPGASGGHGHPVTDLMRVVRTP